MSCKPICKLCNRLILSQAVTFTGGNLVINIPAGSYQNHEKYCIVIAQTIPDETTINAPVYITIGTGTVLYPLTKSNCVQAVACSIRTRTRYSTCLVTNATGATFRLLGQPCCSPNNALTSVDGTAPTETETTQTIASYSTPSKVVKTITNTHKEVTENA